VLALALASMVQVLASMVPAKLKLDLRRYHLLELEAQLHQPF
jgi:hypothetical protein